MTQTTKKIRDKEIKEPLVVFPLKQYESLMEYIEDIEDRLTLAERKHETLLSQEEVDNLFDRKYGEK